MKRETMKQEKSPKKDESLGSFHRAHRIAPLLAHFHAYQRINTQNRVNNNQTINQNEQAMI